ncbi:hypothetical protein CAPTEDRAFT_213894 [Capitella teleta]|uniref:Uncharacterized protein n=1 Tax=Capitella teleta TaxID=283909 RepID=R7T6Y2_CAPTE|nr:hypothetical protein CAPTEDRAFT_213894 [Capitella teleta]|eukprot:ELT89295.1 hypothetical protein CAPTEDRAFT_213894 [Capitella teleta]
MSVAAERFCQGLSTLGVLKAIRAYPEAFSGVFRGTTGAPTAKCTLDLFEVPDTLAPVGFGSNLQNIQAEALTNWRELVYDLEIVLFREQVSQPRPQPTGDNGPGTSDNWILILFGQKHLRRFKMLWAKVKVRCQQNVTDISNVAQESEVYYYLFLFLPSHPYISF